MTHLRSLLVDASLLLVLKYVIAVNPTALWYVWGLVSEKWLHPIYIILD